MIARALDTGVPAAGYVPAVACHHRVAVATGKHRADELAACLPRAAWQRYSAGPRGH
jgi:hypothetical protein